jgi:RNA polymerase sigma factor (sigma-70 family)
MSMLEIEDLSHEEVEALRLRHLKEMEQEEVAKAMNTSRATVQRILTSGYKKIISALVKGKAIAIHKEL